MTNAAIIFDAAEQEFNSIALDGTYGTWSIERLLAFSARISATMTTLYPTPGAYDKHLKRPPSTIPESLSSVDTEEGDAKEQHVAEPMQPPGPGADAPTSTTRAKLPAKLVGKCSKFSAAKVELLGKFEIAHFAANAFSDKTASPESHVHLEIARKIIKWRFYQTDNIQSFTSPSKSLPRGKPAEAKGLMEDYVQCLLSRVVFPLCQGLGLTLHDARSYPKVHLVSNRFDARRVSHPSFSLLPTLCSYSSTVGRTVSFQASRTFSSVLKEFLSGSSR